MAEIHSELNEPQISAINSPKRKKVKLIKQLSHGWKKSDYRKPLKT